MIILSLDLSMNSTGYAVFDSSKRKKENRLLDYGVINNKHLTSEQTGLKLYHIEIILKGLLIAYNPQAIVVEELTGNGFADTTKSSMVHGILNKLTIKFDNIHYINNKTLKKQFGGYGNADKEDMANRVRLHYPNMFFRTDDVSDAMALGIYYLQTIGEWK